MVGASVGLRLLLLTTTVVDAIDNGLISVGCDPLSSGGCAGIVADYAHHFEHKCTAKYIPTSPVNWRQRTAAAWPQYPLNLSLIHI